MVHPLIHTNDAGTIQEKVVNCTFQPSQIPLLNWRVKSYSSGKAHWQVVTLQAQVRPRPLPFDDDHPDELNTNRTSSDRCPDQFQKTGR